MPAGAPLEVPGKDFGPLFVAMDMDAHGRSLYETVRADAHAKLEALAARL